jgi:hypothetical protein
MDNAEHMRKYKPMKSNGKWKKGKHEREEKHERHD